MMGKVGALEAKADLQGPYIFQSKAYFRQNPPRQPIQKEASAFLCGTALHYSASLREKCSVANKFSVVMRAGGEEESVI